MNKKQKWVLIAVALVILVMLLFPPFSYHPAARVQFNNGYHFILNPPSIHNNGFFDCVNVPLMLAQWVGVLIIGAILFFIAREGET